MARSGYRYGAWHGGPDPLEPPFDVRRALDEIGDDVLAGASPGEALRRLLQQGTGDPGGLRGLDELRRKVRRQARQARRRGRLDGTLEQVRELLDRALAAERRELFPDPDDSARFAEAQLDALPNDPARAVRELSDYQWRSDEARQAYEEIKDLLRREVLDSQFRGMRDALRGASAEDMARIREMISALNDMLEADARGEHTQDQFDRFMAEYGEFFPENPADLAELVDTLARRAAAQQRLLDSLSDEQRQELADLMAGAMGDAGLAGELERLQQGLRAARPDLRWGGRERMDGDRPLGLGDATGALQEIADLEELDAMLDQDYPGASLDDIDPELVERALGRQAVDDVEALRRIERELQRQGYLNRSGGQLELTARAVRRLGATALRRVFSVLDSGGRGTHDVRDAGAAGEPTGSSRGWEYGDEQPLDVVRTIGNAVRRQAGTATLPIRLQPDDFEVAETERRASAVVALCVDLSYSMFADGRWGPMKQTALALSHLVATKYPQDALQIIGFG
ncbi:MAG TPA: hypothetical protein VHS32_00110, partial [Streptosporangiaceae bacterium]|nr:hypothetical protein [Streptosporangiaceae bacterium]